MGETKKRNGRISGHRLLTLKIPVWASSRIYLTVIILVAAVSRFLTQPVVPYSWDAYNYILAIRHFRPLMEMPHFPGYPLQVMMGKLFTLVVGDPHAALQLWSLVEGVLALFLMAEFGRRVLAPMLGWDKSHGEWLGAVGTLLLLFHPMVWHFSSVALGNIAALWTSLLGVWSILAAKGKRNRYLFTVLLIGLMMGVRLETAFLIPFLLYRTVRDRKSIPFYLEALLAGVVGIALWMVPVMLLSGDPLLYLKQGVELFRGVHALDVAESGGRVSLLLRHLALLLGLSLFSAGFGLLPLALWPRRCFSAWRSLNAEFRSLFAWWVIPGLLLLMIGHLRSGYLMVLLPVFVYAVAMLLISVFSTNWGRLSAVSVGMILSLAWFLLPFAGERILPFSLERMKRHDRVVQEVRDLLRQQETGDNDALLFYDAELYPWRAAMVDFSYVRCYQVLDLPGRKLLVEGFQGSEHVIPWGEGERIGDLLAKRYDPGRFHIFGSVDSASVMSDFPGVSIAGTDHLQGGTILMLVNRTTRDVKTSKQEEIQKVEDKESALSE